MAALEVQDIHKSFLIPAVKLDTVREHILQSFKWRMYLNHRRELRVLNGVSFSVRAGETLGIMGRNASGKSTLLKIITGIYRPDQGAVRCALPITPILDLGVGWNPELDATDNICLLGTVMGLTLRELKTAKDEILEFAGLGEFARLELKHYSSGMAMRLAYSVAFRAVRGILILDEVFAVGDMEFKEKCYARYEEIRRAGHTVLMVSHTPTDIARFCDRAILLEGGRIVREGSGPDIADAYVRSLTGEKCP
ncbi:MAG TPA: ATP-binding cassette domain-containing protein [Smithellaceae bacterium]|nr:ATP-binding cassette domain-containing protein [Smithellaceae bacterium]